MVCLLLNSLLVIVCTLADPLFAMVEQYFERDRVTDLGKDLHRVYYDVLAFEYKVELMRSETSGGKTRVQRYTLFVSYSTFNSCLEYFVVKGLKELTRRKVIPITSHPTTLPNRRPAKRNHHHPSTIHPPPLYPPSESHESLSAHKLFQGLLSTQGIPQCLFGFQALFP